MGGLNRKYIRQNFWSFFLLYIGLAQLLDYYFSINIYGISFFITLLPFSALIIIYIFNNKFNRTFYIITYFALVILSLRAILYNENFLIALKYSFPYIFMFFVIKYLLDKSSCVNISNKLLTNILVFILILHFINSVLYFTNSNLVIDNPDKNSDTYVEIVGTRFSGIMGGPNVTANFISLIFAFLVFFRKLSLLKLLIFFTFASIAILPTLSRGAFVVLSLVTSSGLIQFFYQNKVKPTIIFGSISMLFVFSWLIFFQILPYFDDLTASFIGRFIDGDFEGRSARLDFFYEIMDANYLHYLIGIPWNLQTRSADFSISDNSFTLVASNFGFVYFIFFLLTSPIKEILDALLNIRRPKLLVYSFILMFVIFNNNSVLWTSWVFLAFFGFSYLKNVAINNEK